MGFINYENNKFCILLGYTIESAIHYNDCRDCQRVLKLQHNQPYAGKPVEQNQMAGSKKQ